MVLVLLPGLDGSGLLFEPLLRALGGSLSVQVLAYPAQLAGDYDTLAAWVRTQLPDQAFVLLAESFSGPVALRIARQPPPGMQGLVLCATFVRSPRPLLRYLLPLLSRLPLQRVPLRWGRFFLTTPWRLPSVYWQRLQAAWSVQPRAHILQRLRAISVEREGAAPVPPTLPILCLHPAADRLLPRKTTQCLRASLPQAIHVQIAGPHFLLQTCPEAAAVAIQHFLGQLPSGGQKQDDCATLLTSSG
ncbi:alpha/beta fold hydrolase [Leeia aquatica]|uniref:Alpha/beta hydrolase n=1 Tax=Leeia aquatica TaxID=2725557 RepID=A0A847S922_9NEIS|nr:alpha/beta hydrolase [Leeia aquatica]NLR73859.1 alpha/beta hydrolase [Leeia aquatica]